MAESKGLPIFLLGFMDNMSLEFRRYLSASDVFILPSRSEAQPLAALEALAMGLPVVASTVGGLGELVTPQIGFTFEPGDAAALAGIISRLRGDSILLSDLQANARPYVVANYSWEKIAAKYINLFQRCQSPANWRSVTKGVRPPAVSP
jgi:glycogen(starch) synthase